MADAVTFLMFNLFKLISPSEMHDGAWQVSNNHFIYALSFYIFLIFFIIREKKDQKQRQIYLL